MFSPPSARRRRRTSAVLVFLAAIVGWAALLGPGAPPARADDGERIRRLDVVLALRADASMHVTETIVYDFAGSSDRHGIERVLPLSRSYDDDRNRVYPLSHATASSPSGAPADLDRSGGSTVTLRVGDPDTTVRGVQTYRLDYDLGAVVDAPASGPELYWNAVGTDWSVPIESSTVTVRPPSGAEIEQVACYRGDRGSDRTCPAEVAGDQATFRSAGALDPGQGLTVVAGFPAGAFTDTAPVLEEKWRIQKAFALTPGTGAGAGAVLLALAGGAAVVATRKGRDRRYLDVVPGLAPRPGEEVRTARVGVRRPPIAVRFTPPDDLRVGELGTLIDERADVVDVTATIVDLAVRGHLRIEELGTPGEKEPDDWRLVRTGEGTADLCAYERTLYQAIFDGRSEVLLSDLRTTFHADLARTQSELYREVVERGWFTADPRTVRRRWYALGGVLLGLGVVATVLLAAFTHLALLGAALLLAGIVVLVLAPRMPARTAAGTALLAQARGFRLYLETAEADQLRFEEQQDIFSRYLPYAIVFGVAKRWAGVFAEAAARSGVQPAGPGWYLGADPSLNYLRMGVAMEAFSSQAGSAIAAAAPSSSSSSGFSGGFAGGGGGGGGGGSW